MMNDSSLSGIPGDIFRRLPNYLNVLEQFHRMGRSVVSEENLARHLGLPLEQLQSDVEHVVGLVGPNPNLKVDDLFAAIRRALGWSDDGRAVLVGAGRLADSLVGHPAFRNQGIEIVAAFDADPSRVGQEIGGVLVLPMEKIETLVPRVHAQLGILTLPTRLAQNAADRLVAAGIRTLWNFTPCRLEMPSDIIVVIADVSEGIPVLRPATAPSMA
jgi:redox-sensing transcriptional repressor